MKLRRRGNEINSTREQDVGLVAGKVRGCEWGHWGKAPGKGILYPLEIQGPEREYRRGRHWPGMRLIPEPTWSNFHFFILKISLIILHLFRKVP